MAKDGYHHGNLKEALVDAAEALLHQGGEAALSLRKAAERAGVSRAAPYHHFADKEALVAAVCERGFAALGLAMAEAEAVADPWDRLTEMGRRYVAFAVADPELYKLMFGPAVEDKLSHAELHCVAMGAFGLLTRSLLACRETGEMRDGPLEDLAFATWSMVHGLAGLLADGMMGPPGVELAPAEQLIELQLSLIKAGMRRG